MSHRRLSPDERALWDKVAASVKPLHAPKSLPFPVSVQRTTVERTGATPASGAGFRRSEAAPVKAPSAPPTIRVQHTLDGSWDKRLTKGDVCPDVTIDLHGETLATAHARLNRSLVSAVRTGARVILLITGKPAQDNPRLPPTSRGVIRASVHDWLMASPAAHQIAAIRNAHPRHGGAGALYVILRRGR